VADRKNGDATIPDIKFDDVWVEFQVASENVIEERRGRTVLYLDGVVDVAFQFAMTVENIDKEVARRRALNYDQSVEQARKTILQSQGVNNG